ncbi:hypothetical protein [Ulvibacter antarcticus]|uniref:Ig-like domain-containing protein n=1 Tax=Ulvibacter antarcticus TaxID=442714 RepID=A0A3L9Z226_9FLAO|nr:hypothetical protein [Ulvibacter antarcticus]RMA66057.1 hypothetical protein BXY75_0475 [Ulvibacter antarcticus]
MLARKLFLVGTVLSLLFVGCNKGDDGDDTPPIEKGNLTFYINDVFPCAIINIGISNANGTYTTAQLNGSSVNPGTPSCNETISVTIPDLPYDVYTWFATCDTDTQSGPVSINSSCFVIKLNP